MIEGIIDTYYVKLSLPQERKKVTTLFIFLDIMKICFASLNILIY